jgi:hypothetical protein
MLLAMCASSPFDSINGQISYQDETGRTISAGAGVHLKQPTPK